VELQKGLVDMKLQQEMFLRSMKEEHPNAPMLPMLENLWNPAAVVLDEKLAKISTRLEKLDKLDHVMTRLDSFSPMLVESPKRNMSTIRSEIERLTAIILDDRVDIREREAANMKIDKLYTELYATDEYKAEVKKEQEEKSRINDPLNQEALKNMLVKIENNDEEFRKRRKQYLALQLIGADKDVILGKHQSDYNAFPLTDLTEEELRAIRASLPTYKKEQKRQQDFVGALELKIQQVRAATAARPVEKITKKSTSTMCMKFPSPRLQGAHGRAGSMADLVSELSARKTATAR